jgi:hypothetical protein
MVNYENYIHSFKFQLALLHHGSPHPLPPPSLISSEKPILVIAVFLQALHYNMYLSSILLV